MKKRKCNCGGIIIPNKYFSESFLLDCLKCDRCNEVSFTLPQARILLKLREANKKIEGKRKIIKVGSSIAAHLPKKVKKLGIKEGLIDNIRVLSANSLQIEFNKDIV